MKQRKRSASLILTLIMAVVLMVPASAEGQNGSITIKNAIPGETYNVYQIFSLESYNTGAGTYAYRIAEDSPWQGFVQGAGAAYVEVDAQGYVTWKGDNTDARRAAFAKAALIYAQDGKNSVTATRTSEAKGTGDTTTVVFSGLDLGYYLVDSSLGTLAILGSTSPDFTQEEKNEVPAVDKKVQTDPTNDQYGETNSANIGQEVTFQTTITAKAGAQNYVLHDTMTGLTFKEITSVQWREATGFDPKTNQYTYGSLSGVAEGNYTITESTTDGCTFELSFAQGFLDALDTGDQIVVTYKATVSDDAVNGGAGNPNDTRLTYGDKNRPTSEVGTKTYTYYFDLVKTKSDNTVLDGAKFKLYDAETGGNEIPVVEVAEGYYRIAKTGETGVEISAGKVTIKGLANGTYWLEEIQQPTGYNKLDGRTKVVINGANLSATVDGSTWKDGGVHIVNNTGTELPSTGGVGTTIFYVLGGVLMIGALVLLITKKRMDQTGK